jgi:hypothetical protein
MRQLGAAGPDRPRQQSLPCRRSFNPLFRRAGSITPPLGPPRRAGVEHALGRGCTVCVGRPSVVWLCGLYGRSPVLVQYAPRWLYRALKKTPERRGALHYQSELSQANQPWNHPFYARSLRTATEPGLEYDTRRVCTVVRGSKTQQRKPKLR